MFPQGNNTNNNNNGANPEAPNWNGMFAGMVQNAINAKIQQHIQDQQQQWNTRNPFLNNNTNNNMNSSPPPLPLKNQQNQYPQQQPQNPYQQMQQHQQQQQQQQQKQLHQQQALQQQTQQRVTFQNVLAGRPDSSVPSFIPKMIHTPKKFDVALTMEQKKKFISEGYIHLPNVVPTTLVHRALRAINRSIANTNNSPQIIQLPKGTTSCPDLVTSKVMMDLLNESPALTYAEQLIGDINRVLACQIALRYPGDGCVKQTLQQFDGLQILQNPLIGGIFNQLISGDDKEEDSNYVIGPHWEKFWHIDGFPQAIQLLQQQDIPKQQHSVMNFTCLLGIYLSALPQEYCGNLTVYPGSHLVLQDYFRDQGGVIKLIEGPTYQGIKMVVEGVSHKLSKPVQLIANPGDIVLCHYQLGHCIAPNVSPNVRYAVYFRLHSHRHNLESSKPECLTNIWLDFEGIQHLTKQ